ncbi:MULTISPECIES: hypothetical protein [unclassified Pseudoalteromonas]|uniref:hypothetical protein n=1 Tax=unclassified Pseudoalteromonas TaxID=194690 RepID=UPI00237DB728|nr:hypothetical protein [Pseudoalteromonas sp. G4]MDE3274029.1 hypothetical protein [Pseudoalteromonas sp. G4]
MMLWYLLALLVINGYLSAVVAGRFGLVGKRWAIAGLLTGPAVYSVINVKQRMLLRKSLGFVFTRISA